MRNHVADAGRAIGRGGAVVALLARPGAATRSPSERSVLDDVAMRRPWNLRVKAARIRARLRLRSLEPGVTVVVVNWNTWQVTADVLSAVQRLSPSSTRVLLIDNGSTDGSRERFAAWPGIETMLLSSNAGHGVALDLGVCAARTTVTVTLDSDAIPLCEGWLDAAVEPVLAGEALIAGLRSSRNFVHPVFLALDTEAFVKRGLSFQVHVEPRPDDAPVIWGSNGWDTGEIMFRSFDPDEVRFLEPTPNAAPGLPGMTTASVVYHHGGVSRNSDGDTPDDSLSGWRQACRLQGLASEVEPGRCSVIIPAYNVEEYVAEAIESALDQTYGDVEVVVVNDGSTDATVDRIGPFMDQIVYVEQENGGLSAARNTGIRNATGEFVGLLDADDIWAPERLARCIGLLRERPDVGFVTTDAFLIYERAVSTDRFFDSKGPFPTGDFPQQIVRRNFMFVAAVARRSLYDQVGLFDESLRAVEDYDMWLRFISNGARPVLIDEPLAYYRMREGSLTTDRTHIAESLYAVLEKRLPAYWAMNIFGNAQEAWTIGQRALARGDRQQARRFFVAASRDAQKTALQRARMVVAAYRRTVLS